MGAPPEVQAPLVLGERLDGRLDAGAVDLEEEAARPGLADGEAVAGPAVQQVDGLAGRRVGVRAPAAGERVEGAALGRRGGLAERDRRLHERGVGVPDGLDVALRLQPVQPARVDLSGAQLGAAQQLEQETLVGVPSSIATIVSATARRRRAIACSRLSPWAMIFAIIESNSGGTLSPSATPVSTRMPGPAGRRSRVMRPGAGEKPRAGSSALRRTSIAWPRGGGGSPSSRPPAATWSCSRTRSAPVTASVTGCSTCRRVLTSMNEKRRLSGS